MGPIYPFRVCLEGPVDLRLTETYLSDMESRIMYDVECGPAIWALVNEYERIRLATQLVEHSCMRSQFRKGA